MYYRSYLFLIIAVLFITNSIVAQEYVIKFSHVVSPTTPKGKAAALFAKMVNQRLKGRVQVEVYPNSILYDDDTVLDAMRLSRSQNQVIIAAPSLSKFIRYSSKLQLFDLPYFFDSINDIHKLTDSPLAEKLTSDLPEKEIAALAFWDNGWKVFTVKGETPLREIPTDFNGKKIRIQPSNIHEEMVLSLGGIPLRLPFKDVYLSLAKSIIDGQENTWSNTFSERYDKIQSFITVSNHSYLGYLVVTQHSFWQNLPADIRDEIIRILREVTVLSRQYANEAAIEDRRKVEASGNIKVINLEPEELAKWKKFTSVVENKFKNDIGVELLQEVHQFLD